jgi:hypothetical protein
VVNFRVLLKSKGERKGKGEEMNLGEQLSNVYNIYLGNLCPNELALSLGYTMCSTT